MELYCELCGKQIIRGEAKYIYVDGAYLRVCIDCFNKSRGKQIPRDNIERRVISRTVEKKPGEGLSTYRKQGESGLGEEYEVVEDYAARIREARERVGWSQEALASRLKISVGLIKRIETGRLKPGIELARRIEMVLGIKLIEPVVDEEIEHRVSKTDDSLTIGDIIRFDKDKRKK